MIKANLLTIVSSLVVFCMAASSANAAIRHHDVEYSTPDSTMEGYIAYDNAKKSPQPAIIIVHDWMGLADFQKHKADELAKQGYVTFAIDIYGKDVRPKNADEAKVLATKYKSDRALLRSHIVAAYNKLIAMKRVDPNKIVVMGYCFGGTAALELARSGVPLAGTVTFHGGLSNPTPEDAKNIHGAVLVLHGADDPFVPPAEVEAFKKEMNDAGINYTFIAYAGAVHAFAIPSAGDDPSKGMAYNASADKASWAEFEKFLKKILE